jgi:hypothetical protein
MSAPAAAPQTREDFLALVVAMGGDREKGFDPFPPDQYTAFLDQDLQLSPRGHNLLALIRFRCLRPKKGGRTPYATDERGRPLQKKQVAEFFGWDLPAVSKIWRELEEKQLVKEKDGKLWLNGTVPQAQVTGEAATGGRRRKAPTLPRYVRDQIQKLPPDQARRAERAFFLGMQVINDFSTDAMYLARSRGEEYMGELMAPFGIKLRRHEPDEEEANTRRAPLVELSAKLSVQDLFQRLETEPVQAIESTVYSENNGSVQSPYPYSSKDKADNKVSSGEAAAPEALSCEDSLTHNEEAEAIENTEDGEPGADETAPAKTLPVDEEGTRPTREESPAVAFVQKFWNKPLSDQLRAEFENLAPKFGISQMAVARFLLDKMEEKIRVSYFVDGPPALLNFAHSDLPGWIKQNRAYVARTAEREAPAAVPAAPVDPAENLANLERLIAENPAHNQIEEWRQEAAELRRQLGDQAPPPYEPEPPENELERLQAHLAELPAGEHANLRHVLKNKIRGIRDVLAAELAAALDFVAANPEDPTSDRARERIAKLKTLLTTKANGAAG